MFKIIQSSLLAFSIIAFIHSPSTAQERIELGELECFVDAGTGFIILVGGSSKTFALQPVSLQTQKGLNIAAGVAEIELRSIVD